MCSIPAAKIAENCRGVARQPFADLPQRQALGAQLNHAGHAPVRVHAPGLALVLPDLHGNVAATVSRAASTVSRQRKAPRQPKPAGRPKVARYVIGDLPEAAGAAVLGPRGARLAGAAGSGRGLAAGGRNRHGACRFRGVLGEEIDHEFA